MTANQSALVLSIDGLSARLLGPYANTWFSTHQFDRLASQSLLMEFAFSDCPTLEGSFRSLWGKTPGFSEWNPNNATNSLVLDLANQGIESTLFTDHPEVAELSIATEFDRLIVPPQEEERETITDPSETNLAEFFATGIEHAATLRDGEFLWLHSQGLQGPWDAPYEMRCQFADPEDPDPPTFIDSPALIPDGNSEIDPDDLLGFQQACAAQVVLIDQFLGILLDHLDSLPASQQPLFILTAPRGFPLGSGGFVGNVDQTLFDESVHVPLMVRWPDRQLALCRNQSLVYSACMGHLIHQWFGGTIPEQSWLNSPLPDKERELILSVNSNGFAVRTQSWKLIEQSHQQQLFVKPDDRWERNDVRSKCRWIAESLGEVSEQLRQQVTETGGHQVLELPESLIASHG